MYKILKIAIITEAQSFDRTKPKPAVNVINFRWDNLSYKLCKCTCGPCRDWVISGNWEHSIKNSTRILMENLSFRIITFHSFYCWNERKIVSFTAILLRKINNNFSRCLLLLQQFASSRTPPIAIPSLIFLP